VPNEIWDKIISETPKTELKGPFKKGNGSCWSVNIPEFASKCDTCEFPRRSPLVMFENSRRLTVNHAHHSYIANPGKGFYSHWGNDMLFSTTDNSDPNTNGRSYSILDTTPRH